MKKLFVSLPMHGRTEEDIKNTMVSALIDSMRIVNEPLILIDTYIKDHAPENAGRLWYLGDSISLMDQADFIYFADGWELANGCQVEHMCAQLYNKTVIKNGMIVNEK